MSVPETRPRQAGRELRGARLGIVGYGPSGRAVARLAHPDPNREFLDLDTVCATADYLSLHCRADHTTHHLIDATRLEAMKSTAVLINTARGSLVDENSLLHALTNGHIAGAALDVLAGRDPAHPVDPQHR
ncbi:NAD(P)-dependent oxidoreductase [Nocardia wallacei]|uniref:NAD(P)-dependent oxidoreductase n=1 Tax=Nocardia wallacei TaxID=480035 RepID=UPI00245394F0|nr:NAD(P)-dependent oxidoreductase [Nocardia wallacei]